MTCNWELVHLSVTGKYSSVIYALNDDKLGRNQLKFSYLNMNLRYVSEVVWYIVFYISVSHLKIEILFLLHTRLTRQLLKWSHENIIWNSEHWWHLPSKESAQNSGCQYILQVSIKILTSDIKSISIANWRVKLNSINSTSWFS